MGLMLKTVENLYTSLGAGYWQRDVLREYKIVNDEGIMQSTGWAKDRYTSKKGIKIDFIPFAMKYLRATTVSIYTNL